jgi:flagellar basal-body rod modification protein FlgD
MARHFLTLLVAQLKYQDPLGPKDDTEFLSQLAQMNSLEEMQKLNFGMSSIQAYSLVGKYAYAEVLDSKAGTKNIFSGTIDSIVSDSGTIYAVMGEDAVKLEDIVQVFDPNLLNTDMTLAQSSDLIGKTVTGSMEAEGGLIVQVTGVVTGVTVEDGVVYAIAGGQRSPWAVSQVFQRRQKKTIKTEVPLYDEIPFFRGVRPEEPPDRHGHHRK